MSLFLVCFTTLLTVLPFFPTSVAFGLKAHYMCFKPESLKKSDFFLYLYFCHISFAHLDIFFNSVFAEHMKKYSGFHMFCDLVI